jgi:hypothetical protein
MTFHLHHTLASGTLLVGLLASSGCQQPIPNCGSAHGAFAARYELVEGDPASACGALLGDVVGLNSYYANGGARPNLEKGSVAIRPQYLNDMVFHAAAQGVVDETMNDGVQSVGDFIGPKPGDDDFCEAETFSATQLSLPEVPAVADDPETPDEDESLPAQPATTIRYEWTNARILVTPDAQGTQFVADMHFEQDGCEADYRVVGVFPAVGCATNAECNDDANGINPSFSVECAVDLGLCVLTDEPPAYE